MEKIGSPLDRIFQRFLLYASLILVCCYGLLLFGIGFMAGIRIIAVTLPIALLAAGAAVPIIYSFHKRVKRLTEASAESITDDDVRYFARYPFVGMVIIQIASVIGITAVNVAGYKMRLFLSAEQGALFIVSNLIVAIALSMLYFYAVRINLYLVDKQISYNPLTLLEKIAIPTVAAILIITSILGIGIYRFTYRQVYSLKSRLVEESVRKNRNHINEFFSIPLTRIKSMGAEEEIRSMNPGRIESYLRSVHDSGKENMIEMFLAADSYGNCVTSLGQRTNISDRDYFRRVMDTGTPVFSEPIVSKATGKTVITCAVPVVIGGRTAGVMGAAILMEEVEALLKSDTITGTGRYMLITKEGKAIFHPNTALIGKIIGKDITDNGETIIGITKVVTEPEETIFDYVFNGSNTYSFKTAIPVMGNSLVFTFDQADMMREINAIILEIIAGLIGAAMVLFLVIRKIALNFSQPIRKTINAVHKLADGDLTVENDAFLPDEFGELIRSIKVFQRRLKDIISMALESSTQLSMSAEELANTSSSLSDGAQTQAASVEEASASLEEVSGAVELINNNAGEQATLSRDTFKSMDTLKKNNETVAGYASEALKTAQGTTEQANTGRRLMESTIEGMNRIDDSTKKIADNVRFIGDISDQVNLLALNASIEAARAGDHGKGFAVVAEEISKLADETAVSAKNINDLVKTGLAEVGRGREYVDATGAALKNIIGYIAQTEELVRKITESAQNQTQASMEVLNSTRRVMEMAESISSSTNEQMMTNQEMSKTVEQINQNTQSAAAAAEQIASSAEEISAQAEALRGQMEFFRV